jgi:hypothetical protein
MQILSLFAVAVLAVFVYRIVVSRRATGPFGSRSRFTTRETN